MAKDRHNWEVVVGNVGTVYSGTNGFEANKTYQQYVRLSEGTQGRASGEDVALFKDGEITKEHVGDPWWREENPIPSNWTAARVRRNPRGQVQVKLPLRRRKR